jgi:hypothetical protein
MKKNSNLEKVNLLHKKMNELERDKLFISYDIYLERLDEIKFEMEKLEPIIEQSLNNAIDKLGKSLNKNIIDETNYIEITDYNKIIGALKNQIN